MVYYKLHDWIDESKIYWCELSGNTLAEDYLKDHPDKIIWTRFSEIIKDEQFAIEYCPLTNQITVPIPNEIN